MPPSAQSWLDGRLGSQEAARSRAPLAAILQYATTREVSKILPGKSAYACMLNERGMFVDDCILYRTGPNSWMVVFGTPVTISHTG